VPGRHLVADIGGTHARFAVAEGGRLTTRVELPSADHPDLASAARAALAALSGNGPITAAAIAVAAPIAGDRVALTNVDWKFSIDQTRRELGLERLVLLNDLEAAALALPWLAPSDLEVWRAGAAIAGAPRAVVGVGTGLGTAALIERPDGAPLALAAEGGHRDLAAANEGEWAIVRALSARFGRVSAERAISGTGLSSLYESLSSLDGVDAEETHAAEIVRRAVEEREARAIEACRLLSGWLGAFAGDLVLTLGARGGLFLVGGALAGMREGFDRERFFARLDAKGRFRAYVAAVPVARITTDDAALFGAAHAFDRSS